jgi:hypothetical protein
MYVNFWKKMKGILYIILTIFLFMVVQISNICNAKNNTFLKKINTKDTINLLKDFNLNQGTWKLIGFASSGSSVSAKFKKNNIQLGLHDFFKIEDIKILENIKQELKGTKVDTDYDTGDIILKLLNNDKIVWEAYVI